MPAPSFKTAQFATVNVPASTLTKISAASLTSLGYPHDLIAQMDAVIIHTGLATDGVTPTTATVELIRHVDDAGLLVRTFDDTADETDPYLVLDENFPSDIGFYTTAVGGVRLRVEITIRPVFQLRPSSGGGSYLP